MDNSLIINSYFVQTKHFVLTLHLCLSNKRKRHFCPQNKMFYLVICPFTKNYHGVVISLPGRGNNITTRLVIILPRSGNSVIAYYLVL